MKTPTTQHDITASNLDGDAMTGYQQQTAFDGDPSTRADLFFSRDGNPLNDPARAQAFDGNAVNRPGDDLHGVATDARRREELDDVEPADEEMQPAKPRSRLPSPFDAPSPFKR